MNENAESVSIPSPEETVILVVDDVVSNVQIVGSILATAGYQVIPATNGEEALRFALNPPPDLILLDVMMPEMDGFEVCQRLKSAPETSAIPIIFLTAAVASERIVKGLDLGGVDYITKPFNASELLARVRIHLELKFSREILVRTAAQLRQLNKEKNDFLEIAAHDLKSPICNFIELAEYSLISPDLDRTERDQISTSILNESTRLLQLVEELLNIEALERGHLKVELVPCDLREILETVLSMFQDRAKAKQQTIAFEPRGQPTQVLADPRLTHQILENLISNALKFSPAGKAIKVSVSETAAGIVCEVQDEGPGLSDKDQKELFNKFARLSAKPTAGEPSTGLGLAIVKKLVESMNGSVRCESQFGHGARFIVTLPIARG